MSGDGERAGESVPDKKKLFVSNLDFEITQDQLHQMFSEIGAVVSCVVATDRETKRSKGFAFVELEQEGAAEKAVAELSEKIVNGRPIKVSFDRGKGGSGGGSSHFGHGGGAPGGRKFEILPPIQRTQLFRRRRKMDPFIEDPSKAVDYRDVATLSRFVSERGRILARRYTGLSAFFQRRVARAIKRAQNLGLMPYNN